MDNLISIGETVRTSPQQVQIPPTKLSHKQYLKNPSLEMKPILNLIKKKKRRIFEATNVDSDSFKITHKHDLLDHFSSMSSMHMHCIVHRFGAQPTIRKPVHRERTHLPSPLHH